MVIEHGLPNHEPEPRCKGREVTFHRQGDDGDSRAVEVAFVSREQPQRARLHSPRNGRTHY